MKAFISWSGGKDCAYALYKSLQENSRGAVVALLNVDKATTQNAHHLANELLQAQADTIGIFGDIHLQPHRDWIEEGCEKLDL